MGISISQRQAYSEIDEFLDLISEEKRNKVPQKLRDLFKNEKDVSYKKHINIQLPIKEQELKEETLAIIAFLNLSYWCYDEDEKKRLETVYENNKKLYEEILQVEFNPNETFKQKENIKEDKLNHDVMIRPKENIIKKILNKLFIKKFK